MQHCDFLGASLSEALKYQQQRYNLYTRGQQGARDINIPNQDVIKFDIEETIELCEEFIRADEARQQAKYAVYVDDDAFPDAFNHGDWMQEQTYGIKENEFHVITAQHAFKKLKNASRAADAARESYKTASITNAAKAAFMRVM